MNGCNGYKNVENQRREKTSDFSVEPSHMGIRLIVYTHLRWQIHINSIAWWKTIILECMWPKLEFEQWYTDCEFQACMQLPMFWIDVSCGIHTQCVICLISNEMCLHVLHANWVWFAISITKLFAMWKHFALWCYQ